jgi:serine/threonine-protein kinase
VQNIVEDRSNDDGTMMFARVAGGSGASEPGQVLVARVPPEPARQGPRTREPAKQGSRTPEPARQGSRTPEPARQGSRTPAAKGIQLRHSVWSSRALEAATGGAPVRRRSEPAPELVGGQAREDETEDRPTIPSLHPLVSDEDLCDDAEATIVDPTPFPDDMTTLIRGEGCAQDGDPS